ncbi:MAG: DNA-directed RNA polymerase subunit omega [Planctomycetes bacterium ADurb.Bin412]|nr:MAG: DNA-directed RNA polymerase subunit omega [Planctomycetes bacterium ADurb.Bin412]
MIEALKDDKIVKQAGGQFKLTALIQRRLKELIEGSRPLVPAEGKNMVQIAVQEIAEGKIDVDYEKTEYLLRPDEAGMSHEIRTGMQE